MPKTPGKILIVLPNPLGDVVMATPALRALRTHFAGACVTLLGRQIGLDVLAGSGLADQMVADDSCRPPQVLRLPALACRLRAGRFDLAVLLPNSFRSALTAWLAGAKRIAGYDRDGRRRLLTDRLAPKRDRRGGFLPMPAIDYYLDLARFLGAACDSGRMELVVTPGEQQSADELLAQADADSRNPLVMLNPGAAFGPSKMWDADCFAAVADALIEQCGAQIIINAAPSEKPVAAAVERSMRHKPLLNFARRDNTIGMLKGLLRRSDLLITNDTGPRHVAAALGTALVTVFGCTDPVRTKIDCPRERIIRVDVSCSPCQRKFCPQLPGPLYHQCMSLITPAIVLEKALELLRCKAEAAT